MMELWFAAVLAAASLVGEALTVQNATARGAEAPRGSAIFSTQTDFSVVVKKAAFVDKTLLITTLFEVPEKSLITAPRRFGKSTNLDMVRKFLEIPVDAEGKALKKKTSLTYRIFKYNGLKIYNDHRKFFDVHFGKYPVLLVDFATSGPVASYDEAFDRCKMKIHLSFKRHGYLRESQRLDEEERETCRLWYGDRSFRSMGRSDVHYALAMLSEYLHKHFSSKVVVLIDDYDAIVTSAMFKVLNSVELGNIANLVLGIISTVLKTSGYVSRALITGVSYVLGEGLTGLDNIRIYRFLDDHPFVDFYGFTKAEAVKLLEASPLKLSPDQMKKVHNTYNGYVSKSGRSIFSPYSLLNFLQIGRAEIYWSDTGYMQNLKNTMGFPLVKDRIERLLKGDVLEINFHTRIRISDIIKLGNTSEVSDNPEGRNFDANLLLSYLLELGYLTCVVDLKKPGRTFVKIPNDEVMASLIQDLREQYGHVFKQIERDLVLKCASFFKSLPPAADAGFPGFAEHLAEFRDNLQLLYESFEDRHIVHNVETLRSTLIPIVYETKFHFGPEYYLNRRRMDLLFCRKPLAIVMNLRLWAKGSKKRKSQNTAVSAMSYAIENRHFEVVNATEMQEQGIDKYIIFGISLNASERLSIACLVNSPNIDDTIVAL